MKNEDFFSGLHPSLRYVLASWMRWEDLRDVQKRTLQVFKPDSDILILSPTAGGKSEAAFIPVLDNILKEGYHEPVCLYIAPLKALINEMAERLSHILSPLHYDLQVCHGDAPSHFRKSEELPVIILTTPETLMVLLYRRDQSLLSHVRFCIIDELHALAGTMRGSQVIAALTRLEEQTGRYITRIGLSATVGNPDEVLEWLSGGRSRILVQEDTDGERNFEFHIIPVADTDIAEIIGGKISGKRSIIFSGSRKETEMLSLALEEKVPVVFVHHSSLSSDIRKRTEEVTHKDTPFTVLCTSTLELGIDIGDLDMVVQVGHPGSVSSFLQRLGRTGRRGTSPVMYCFPGTPEETVITLSALLLSYQGDIEPVIPPRYPYDLLVREILLQILLKNRVSKAYLSSMLGKKPYQWIERSRFDDMLSFLDRQTWISWDGDLVIPGPGLESLKRRPGMLYSLIGDSRTASVMSRDGEEIGAIPVQTSGYSPFILGGKTWEETGRDEGDSLVVRQTRKPGAPPRWIGPAPAVSRLILSGIQSLVTGTLLPFSVHDEILNHLKLFQAGFPPGMSAGSISFMHDGEAVILYTFLGKSWNQVLGKYLGNTLRCSLKGFNDYSLSLAGIREGQELYAAMRMFGHCSLEDLFAFAPHPAGNRSTYPSLLPDSCIIEQWCVDELNLPLLIRTVRERRLEQCYPEPDEG